MTAVRAIIIGLALALSVPWTALADKETVDGDVVLPGNQNIVAVQVEPGQSASVSTLVVVEYSGSKHLVAGTTVAFGFAAGNSTAPVGGGVSATGATRTVPSPWTGGSFTLPVTATVTAPTAAGTFTYTAKWEPTTSTCTSGDCLTGSAALVINVTVPDRVAPTLSLPASFAVSATSPAGAFVIYSATATDNFDPSVSVICAPPSGFTFPVGTTTVTCSATDAGNNTAGGSFTVTVTAPPPPPDSTPPVIGFTVSGAPFQNGWYRGDVIVTWTITDPESAPTSTGCGSAPLSASGSVTCSATSAGGTASRTANIQIDKTKPTIAANLFGTLGQNDWYVSSVFVGFNCTDTGSGVATCGPDKTLDAEGGNAATGIANDFAGNSSAPLVVNVNIDTTPPSDVAGTLSGGTLGTNGWYTTAPTATFDGTDATSGIDSCTQGAAYAGGDSATASIPGSCTDRAGHSTNGSIGFKLDTTKPTLAPSALPGTILLNGTYGSVTANATDGLSGIKQESCGTIDTSSVGAKTLTCSATDNAGNFNSRTISYAVTYDVACFTSPFKAGAGTFKLGSSVPLKCTVKDANGVSVANATATASTRLSTSTAPATDAGKANGTTSDFRYDAVGQQYIYNWQTKGLTAATYEVSALFNDGSVRTAAATLR